MLKIGDFSKLSQVSVDTLRHYDALGLLRPMEVDSSSGYRYYAFQQLGRLNRILALKDLGLTLDQIARMLAGEEVSAEQLRRMLNFKQAEIELHIHTEHDRLARVEARLKQIEMETNMPNYEVVIKNIRPQLVASIRRLMPAHNQIVPLYEELISYLAGHHVTQCLPITIWRAEGYPEHEVDTEAALTLKAPVPETDEVKVYELPGGTMASVIHNGAYNHLYQAYRPLHEWIGANGYRVTGCGRELYHYSRAPLRFDDEFYVTEVQVPVEKAT